MNIDLVIRNWALVVAAVLLALVVALVLVSLFRRSPSGQLRARARDVSVAQREEASAARKVKSLEQRLQGLHARADRVKPSQISELEGLFGDAKALMKIAGDKTMVAENQLRKVIHEEFPPNRHDALRRRYLPEDREEGRPFTF